ncbi:HLA class II histocompatibility antigen gamma chain [Podarcis lilfordi]|uniref:HLA class II histocompatibility antigen gamma chain n=1 Tax=Podarcis lilfordi TaxID=74358 RepID=A0AA35JW43_9SAUR|nr:HLA class II histocompatibility antigen gamma chain [Podarcis lilfordi]
MEDDRNNLLPNTYTGSAPVPERGSSSRKPVYAAFSILIALLIAGQAVTGYFVYQHNTRISKITKTTTELKLQSLANNLPHAPKAVNQKRMAMANIMPMVMRDPDEESPEDKMKLTNSTEDQIKRLLMQSNPLIKFPDLKKSFMENMNTLKNRLDFEDWKSFETWMHKWLLFQMAKNEIPAEQVKTKCQTEECGRGVHLGRFCAKCDENGDYLPKQCHGSTGFCWCVYKNGTMVEGTTKVRGPLDCTGKGQLVNVTAGDTENVTASQLSFSD